MRGLTKGNRSVTIPIHFTRIAAMGRKGEQRTSAARDTAEQTAERLYPVGSVTTKGMFGGYGLFLDGTMFGLVNSKGVLHLRVDDTTRPRFEAAGGVAHGRMPYVSVPDDVLASDERLTDWANDAVAVAQAR